MVTKERIEDFKKSATYRMALKRGALQEDSQIISYLEGIEELHKNTVYIGDLKWMKI